MLPLIALTAAWAARALPKTERSWYALIALGLIGLGLATALLNESRPLLGRDSVVPTGRIGDVFPRIRPEFRASYLTAIKELKGCRRVAIEVSDDYSWEYPIWTLLPAGVFGDSEVIVVRDAHGRPCSAVIELNQVRTSTRNQR